MQDPKQATIEVKLGDLKPGDKVILGEDDDGNIVVDNYANRNSCYNKRLIGIALGIAKGGYVSIEWPSSKPNHYPRFVDVSLFDPSIQKDLGVGCDSFACFNTIQMAQKIIEPVEVKEPIANTPKEATVQTIPKTEVRALKDLKVGDRFFVHETSSGIIDYTNGSGKAIEAEVVSQSSNGYTTFCWSSDKDNVYVDYVDLVMSPYNRAYKGYSGFTVNAVGF